MKYSPEWMSCEGPPMAPKRPNEERRPMAPYAYHEWAYHPELGLVSRRAGDGGSTLSNDVVDLFNLLWRSHAVPSATDLREFVNVRRFLSDELIGTSVPRYWRCKLRRVVAETSTSTRLFHVAQTCKQEGARVTFMVDLRTQVPETILKQIEPVQCRLLYDVSGAPRAGDGRAPVFVEVALGGVETTVHTERVGVLPNLPPAVGESDPQQVEYDTIEAALAHTRLSIRQLGLVARRDPAISLRQVLEHEARLRHVSLRHVAEAGDGIQFESTKSGFSAGTFEELRDILRWHPDGF